MWPIHGMIQERTVHPTVAKAARKDGVWPPAQPGPMETRVLMVLPRVSISLAIRRLVLAIVTHILSDIVVISAPSQMHFQIVVVPNIHPTAGQLTTYGRVENVGTVLVNFQLPQ